jgi:hypothetical protein
MHSTPPVSPEGGEFAAFIRELSNADSSKRRNAAAAIFQRGCEMARAATSKWFLDLELTSCFLMTESGAPEATMGLAVKRARFNLIRTANGAPRLAEVPDDQDAEEFELDFSGGIRLDILTTRRPGSGGAIDRFLQRFGEGIQQIELQASDVDRATGILRARFGLAPIYPQTRAGGDGTRVNFFLVPAEQEKKVLIELVEVPK